MKYCVACVAAVVLMACPDVRAENPSVMSEASMHESIRYLADDRLEGRAPGSRGETLTIDYLSARFKQIGYAPGNLDGTYLQEVPLVGSTCIGAPELRLTRTDGSWTRPLKYGPEFMGWTLHQQASAGISDAELIFVGYGVTAPEYDWDDYKGIDVKGKIVVMLVGDPPHPDDAVFGGKAMTYYGRWTYKFERAAEAGASGAILVHTTPAAGYPWAVVENSWQGEQFDIIRTDKGASRCQVESWITEAVARELFTAAGLSFDDGCRAAISQEFRASPMNIRASLRLQNRIRSTTSHNVVAILRGNDERLASEHVIYTAHWDHLGVGNPVDGDSIYNGGLDNASGVAGLLEVAAEFAANREQLRRSILFIITTAEESGLIGARHYCEYPLYPLSNAVTSINVDGINVWGRTRDMVIVGWGQSDLDQYLETAIADQERYIVPDSESEKGYYYRSDHFPFAQRGVPALYADSGVEFVGRPEGWGMERRNEYVRLRYHKPQDHYDATWDLSGAMEDMVALFRVGYVLATSDRYPRWSETSEFHSVRPSPPSR